MEHYADLLRQVTFPAHTKQGKMKHDQEKKKNGETKTGKKKGEDRRPILEKLCAALLRLFKKQQGEKMVSVRGVPGVNETLGKVKSHFDLTQTGSGTAPPR